MIFRRMHMPWVVGLILGGMLIGPHGLNLLAIDRTTEFIGQIGLVFLMFMAGIETHVSSTPRFRWSLLWLAFINGFIPFLAGLGVGFYFGYGWATTLLIGIIFISSSIAIVIPSLERHGLLHTDLGQSVVLTSIIQDIASLILLSVFLQNVSPITNLPLLIFYPLVIIALIVLRFLLPKISAIFINGDKSETDVFQQDFRVTFLILLATVIVFEFLGLHPIIAGFFAGLVLSSSVQRSLLKEKIRTISYGVFIPTFFIIIGAQTNIQILRDVQGVLPLVATIVIVSILAKFLSGWLGARSIGFSSDQSLLFGISSVPQLSTTLAVAFAALSLGFIDQQLITAMIMLSIVTVLVSPTLLNLFGRRIRATLPAEDTDIAE